VLTHRNSPLAQGIVELARRLLIDLQPAPEPAVASAAAAPARSSGLLGKLFR